MVGAWVVVVIIGTVGRMVVTIGVVAGFGVVG